jgi:transposase
MTKATRQHPNAPFSPSGRRRMVACVVEQGWSVEAAAERFQVDAKTVRKWVRRFLEEGVEGLRDRSSRPRSCPWATSPAKREQVLELRRQRRWGADHIAHLVGLARSTVQSILNAAGVGRLDRGDRATATPKPVRRYQREHPGELVHVDIKKLAGIPEGGGWRLLGRSAATTHTRSGYRYLHTALDDRTRLVYSEIHDDEKALTAAAFWERAAAFYADYGITVQRVLTDNGACYRSGLWYQACAATGTKVKKTRFRRPQTNGKVERFHRILLQEWAYARPWTSERERREGYHGFCHFYNHHRGHGALGWHTPHQVLASFSRDNLPARHT